jgi:hypothetical protein
MTDQSYDSPSKDVQRLDTAAAERAAYEAACATGGATLTVTKLFVAL